VEPPIACSLGAADLEQRLADWQRLFATIAPEATRVDTTTLSVRVNVNEEQLTTLAGLAHAEAECCPFFRFAIEIDARSTTFVVSVPADAASVLDDFAQLLLQ
jgi:hypothetical protein